MALREKKPLLELFRMCRQFVKRSEGGGSKLSRMDTSGSGFSELHFVCHVVDICFLCFKVKLMI